MWSTLDKSELDLTQLPKKRRRHLSKRHSSITIHSWLKNYAIINLYTVLSLSGVLYNENRKGKEKKKSPKSILFFKTKNDSFPVGNPTETLFHKRKHQGQMQGLELKTPQFSAFSTVKGVSGRSLWRELHFYWSWYLDVKPCISS